MQDVTAGMNRVNPLYVLRNHLAEEAIRAAKTGDASEIDTLMKLLRNPYEAQRDMSGMRVYRRIGRAVWRSVVRLETGRQPYNWDICESDFPAIYGKITVWTRNIAVFFLAIIRFHCKRRKIVANGIPGTLRPRGICR